MARRHHAPGHVAAGVHAAAGGAGAKAATIKPVNGGFVAVNRGTRMPGLGRERPLDLPPVSRHPVSPVTNALVDR